MFSACSSHPGTGSVATPGPAYVSAAYTSASTSRISTTTTSPTELPATATSSIYSTTPSLCYDASRRRSTLAPYGCTTGRDGRRARGDDAGEEEVELKNLQ